jgi:hypothetical protein
VDEFSEELEADIAHHYPGEDLRDVFRDRGGRTNLTWRRLDVLVKGLPRESLSKTRMRDEIEVEPTDEEPKHGPWSLENYQLADLIDRVNLLTRTLVQVNSKDGNIEGEFVPVARPQMKIRRAVDESNAREAYDFLESIRQQHREAVEGV